MKKIHVGIDIRRNGEILRSAQDDRKRARALYAEECKLRKEHEAALKAEIKEKFPLCPLPPNSEQ